MHVYLATDDHTVVDDLPRVNGSREFTWLVRRSDEVRRTWPRACRGRRCWGLQIEQLLWQKKV